MYSWPPTGGRPRTCAPPRPQAGKEEPPVALEYCSLAHPTGWGCQCTSTVLGPAWRMQVGQWHIVEASIQGILGAGGVERDVKHCCVLGIPRRRPLRAG